MIGWGESTTNKRSVCVCERESMPVCERDNERVNVYVCACVCVCVNAIAQKVQKCFNENQKEQNF